MTDGEIQTTIFDYAALDSDKTIRIQCWTAEIKTLVKQAVIQAGQRMINVRNELDHGQFLGWLRLEFPDIGQRTAYNMINVAECFSDANLQNLQVSTSALYLLASSSTPDDARAEALERAEAGETITYSKARQIVNEYKPFETVLEDVNDATIEQRDPMTPPSERESRMCPYCGTVYMAVPAGGVTQCVGCQQLHAYSGPRDTETYGPYCPSPAPVHESPKASHQLMNASTSNEWYTPARYVDAARTVMGGIDLDPASNETANRTVQADRYYTIDDDGFTKAWPGRVFLNPPYGATDGESNQARWSRRLIEQYRAGITQQAVLLVNAVPGNQWFAPLWDFLICFPGHRIRFYNIDIEAGQPTHSNALVYLGPQVARFVECFSVFGVVAGRLAAEGDGVSISPKL